MNIPYTISDNTWFRWFNEKKGTKKKKKMPCPVNDTRKLTITFNQHVWTRSRQLTEPLRPTFELSLYLITLILLTSVL